MGQPVVYTIDLLLAAIPVNVVSCVLMSYRATNYCLVTWILSLCSLVRCVVVRHASTR